jgi:hypothetical protein
MIGKYGTENANAPGPGPNDELWAQSQREWAPTSSARPVVGHAHERIPHHRRCRGNVWSRDWSWWNPPKTGRLRFTAIQSPCGRMWGNFGPTLSRMISLTCRRRGATCALGGPRLDT